MTSCAKSNEEANNMVSSSKKHVATTAAKSKRKSDNPKSKEMSEFEMNRAVTLLQVQHFNREKGYRQGVCEDIAEACDLGSKLKKNAKLWMAFCKRLLKDIGKPNAEQQHDAVRWVLKCMVGSGKDAQKRASFYFRAAGPLVEKGILGKSLAVTLNREGLKALADEHAIKNKAERESKSNTPQKTKPLPANSLDTDDQSVVSEKAKNLERSPISDAVKAIAAHDELTIVHTDLLIKKSAKAFRRLQQGEPFKMKCEIMAVGATTSILVRSIKRENA